MYGVRFAAQAREVIRLYRPWVRQDTSADTVVRATEIAELARLSFWDSLIVAAAEEVGCEELLSEDMGHGQEVVAVRIVNPFNACLGESADRAWRD